MIIQNQKVRLTYSRGQIDPMRVMQVKDQMEKLVSTKRTKGEIREWPPNNQLSNLRRYYNHLRRNSKDDSNNDENDHHNHDDEYHDLVEDEIRRAGLVQYDGSWQPWFFGNLQTPD